MADGEARQVYNVGAIKVAYADRTVAHSVLTEDDLRGFHSMLGADTPDDDERFPIGSTVAYAVELTEAEAERFRQASNCRYVEPQVRATADQTLFPTATGAKFMGADFPGLEQWHGADVPIAILDGGITTAVATANAWTFVAQTYMFGLELGDDEITTSHGCLVAPCAVPYGGRVLNGILADDDGNSYDSWFLTLVVWAVDNGAKLINFSYSGPGGSPVYVDAIEYAQAAGVPIVCSAGNGALADLGYPAAYSRTHDNVFSSINFDENTGARDPSSNHHADASGCAPGAAVLGMTPAAAPVVWSGTSASAPHMTSLIARAATGGKFTPMQAAAALKASARDTGQPASEQGAGAWNLRAALLRLGGLPTVQPRRTNLCVNPSLETNATGYTVGTPRAGITATAVSRASTIPAAAGGSYGFVNITGNGSTSTNSDVAVGLPPLTGVVAGQTYAVSLHARYGADGANMQLVVQWQNAAGTALSTAQGPLGPLFPYSWTRYIGLVVAPAGATRAVVSVALFGCTNTVATSFRFDGVQYEQTTGLAPYFDGSTAGASWLGAADASASTVQSGAVAVRSASQASNITAAATAAKPAGVVAGDLLIAVQAADRNASLASMTAPAGWTPVGSHLRSKVGAVKVWRKTATSSEPASYAFPDPNSSASSLGIVALSGVNPSAPISVLPVFTGNTSASPSHVAPSVTGVTGGVLVTAHFASGTSNAARTFVPPSGMTERVDTNAGSWTALEVNTLDLSASGATGAKTATCSRATPWIGVSLVVAPAVVRGAGAVVAGSGLVVAATPAPAQIASAAIAGAAEVVVPGGIVGPLVSIAGAGGVVVGDRVDYPDDGTYPSDGMFPGGPEYRFPGTSIYPGTNVYPGIEDAAPIADGIGLYAAGTLYPGGTLYPAAGPLPRITIGHAVAVSVAGSGSMSAAAFRVKSATASIAGSGRVTGASAEVSTPPTADVAIGGATPHVAFWVVGDDGETLAPLPHVTGFELSPVRNEAGSIRIDYPLTGKNYELLRAIVDQDVQLEVEIWVGGSANGRMRGLLVEAAGDDVSEDGSWTFAGHFLEYRAHDGLVAPDPTPGNDWETFFDNASPGVVVKTLWQAAQARGTLTDIGTSTFTLTHDSNGVAWSQAVYMSFAPHRHYDEVLADLVEAGVCEWEITPDHELRLYEPGSRGEDLTLGNPPMILRRGRNLREAQRKFSSRDAGTDLWAAGGEGLYDSTADTSARARLGRQIERAISANSIIDEGALTAYVQNKIGEITRGALELTLEIVFGAGQPLPRSGINVGDWIWTDTGRGTATSSGLEYYRVAQWTLTSDGDELRGTFSLNDLMSERISRVEKLLKAVAGGTVVVGASTATPDTKAPAAPTGLGASTLAYTNGEGTTLATITASWQQVTKNADGTALDDISGYRVRYRYVSGPAGWFDAGRVSSLFTSHTWSGVAAGAGIAWQVQAYDKTNLDSEWSAEFQITAAADAGAPPVPVAPYVSAALGIFYVGWTGVGAAGEGMPADFSHVEIYASLTADFTLAEGVYIDRLFGAGEIASSASTYGTTVFVKLASVDRSGNRSELSAQGSVTLQQAVADDIADDIINAAKLADGAVLSAAISPEAVLTPHLSVAAFSDNLVRNGGFEDLHLTSPTVPAGWTPSGLVGATLGYVRDTTPANVDSGNASLQVSLSVASGEVAVVSDGIPVRPADLVLFQARVKASRAVPGFRWQLYLYAEDPAVYTGPAQLSGFTQVAMATSFATIEQQVLIPSVINVGPHAGRAPTFIRVVTNLGAVVGDANPIDVWLDEVRVRSVRGTAEIADAAIQRAKIANLAVSDAQLENASVGKLTAGTFSATMLLSGLIRTATAAPLIEIDGTGIRLFNAAGVNTVNLSTATGTANIVGTITSGVSGRRVRLSGAAAEIQFFPQVGETRYGRIYSYIPDNYPNDVAFEMRSIDGDGATRVARHYLLPDSQAMAIAPRGQGGDLVTTAFAGLADKVVNLYIANVPAAAPYVAGDDDLRGQLYMQDSGISIRVLTDLNTTDGGFISLTRGTAGTTTFGKFVGTSQQMSLAFGNNEAFLTGPGTTQLLMQTGAVQLTGPGSTQMLMTTSGVQLRLDDQNRVTVVPGTAQLIGGGTAKNFIIDHPQDTSETPAEERRWLIHACTESPTAGVEQWGQAVIVDHLAVVELPAYFESLCEQEGRHVFLSPVLTSISGGTPMVPVAAASEIRGGQFHIVCPAPNGTIVNWLVKATRREAAFPVEPLKSEVTVRGDGPYRYLANTQQEAA